MRRKPGARDASCHGGASANVDGLPLVAIVGPPNVGKSLLFNRITGAYVSVSNYPGTTVEITRGRARLPGCGHEIGVVDTPGMFNLLPATDDEKVARRILLGERPSAVLCVLDAKNLERMLPLTLQLLECGLPVILDLNLMDEADHLGLEVDLVTLERTLGIPVVATVGTTGEGLQTLKGKLGEYVHPDCALRCCD